MNSEPGKTVSTGGMPMALRPRELVPAPYAMNCESGVKFGHDGALNAGSPVDDARASSAAPKVSPPLTEIICRSPVV